MLEIGQLSESGDHEGTHTHTASCFYTQQQQQGSQNKISPWATGQPGQVSPLGGSALYAERKWTRAQSHGVATPQLCPQPPTARTAGIPPEVLQCNTHRFVTTELLPSTDENSFDLVASVGSLISGLTLRMNHTLPVQDTCVCHSTCHLAPAGICWTYSL
jgi:hypothetical protein